MAELSSTMMKARGAALEADRTNRRVRYSSDYPSVQAAIDADTRGTVVAVRAVGQIAEAIDIRGYQGGVFESQGANARITSSGAAHTLLVSESDWCVQNVWVDHTGTGEWDAIHSAEEETRIRNVDVDASPRWAINLTGARSQIESCQILRANVGFVRLGGNFSTVSNFIGLGSHLVPAGAIYLKLDGSYCSVSSTTLNNVPSGGVGVDVVGAGCAVDCVVYTVATNAFGARIVGGRGCNLAGSYVANGAGSVGVYVDGADGCNINARIYGGAYGLKVGDAALPDARQVSGTVFARGDVALYLKGQNCYLAGRFVGTTYSVDLQGYYNSVHGTFSGPANIALDWNDVGGLFQNDVIVGGNNNTITGVIRGNLTVSGSNNRIYARVNGTITNTGTGNVMPT